MKSEIKVLIADDTLIAREGWKKILETERGIQVIGESLSAQETIHRTHELQPDVILMDLKWFEDESAGSSAIERIKQEMPEAKVIAITAYPHLISDARKAGADGALSKGFSKAELVELIQAVHRLPGFPSPRQEPVEFDELSEREKQVLALMAEGKTDKEIADALTIAESTAKKHVGNIISKLGAANRTEAVAIGFRKGVLRRQPR